MNNELDRALGSISKLEAGTYIGHKDKPYNKLSQISTEIIETNIKNKAQLDLLNKLIEFYIVKYKGVQQSVTNEMIDEAMEEAMDYASSPFQASLLALARHHLRGVGFDTLDA